MTRLDVSRLLGGFVGMQPHSLTILPFDEIVIAFDAHHFALDRLGAYCAVRSGPGNLNKPLSGESATVDALTGR